MCKDRLRIAVHNHSQDFVRNVDLFSPQPVERNPFKWVSNPHQCIKDEGQNRELGHLVFGNLQLAVLKLRHQNVTKLVGN